jgi:hypothetical protein
MTTREPMNLKRRIAAILHPGEPQPTEPRLVGGFFDMGEDDGIDEDLSFRDCNYDAWASGSLTRFFRRHRGCW